MHFRHVLRTNAFIISIGLTLSALTGYSDFLEPYDGSDSLLIGSNTPVVDPNTPSGSDTLFDSNTPLDPNTFFDPNTSLDPDTSLFAEGFPSSSSSSFSSSGSLALLDPSTDSENISSDISWVDDSLKLASSASCSRSSRIKRAEDSESCGDFTFEDRQKIVDSWYQKKWSLTCSLLTKGFLPFAVIPGTVEVNSNVLITVPRIGLPSHIYFQSNVYLGTLGTIPVQYLANLLDADFFPFSGRYRVDSNVRSSCGSWMLWEIWTSQSFVGEWVQLRGADFWICETSRPQIVNSSASYCSHHPCQMICSKWFPRRPFIQGQLSRYVLWKENCRRYFWWRGAWLLRIWGRCSHIGSGAWARKHPSKHEKNILAISSHFFERKTCSDCVLLCSFIEPTPSARMPRVWMGRVPWTITCHNSMVYRTVENLMKWCGVKFYLWIIIRDT